MGFSDPASPVALQVALAVVLREMSEVLPPHWYQLQGEGLDYLSGLLGLDENTTTYLLKMMGVLKDHGESVRFEQIVFQDALTMVGAEGCSHHGWCRGGS